MNKKILGAVIIALVAIGSVGYYFVGANNDFTCYELVESKSSCNYSDPVDCTDWTNGKRTCNGIITTSYVRKEYRCSESTGNPNSRASYNTACSVEQIDNTPPTIDNGGIK